MQKEREREILEPGRGGERGCCQGINRMPQRPGSMLSGSTGGEENVLEESEKRLSPERKAEKLLRAEANTFGVNC